MLDAEATRDGLGDWALCGSLDQKARVALRGRACALGPSVAWPLTSCNDDKPTQNKRRREWTRCLEGLATLEVGAWPGTLQVNPSD